MELRNFWMIPIGSWSDDLIKLSFVKILTMDKFETIKLPTSLNLYKYNHLISPLNLLYIEVVKTKKNWVLKNILEYKPLTAPQGYSDFVKISSINTILQSYFHENHDAQILEYIVKVLSSTKLDELDIKLFKNGIARRLGFEKSL